MKRFISIVVCALMVMCVASACKRQRGEQVQGGGQLRVAVILKTLSSPYWQLVLGGAEQAGTDFNVKIEAFGPPT